MTMAATRRQPALQIFQDPILTQDQNEPAHRFFSVTDVSSDHHTLLEPPNSDIQNAQSPRKSRQASSSPPPAVLAEKRLNAVSIPAPHENAFQTDSPMKKIPRPMSKQAGGLAGLKGPIFATFPSQLDKENMYSMSGLPQGLSVADPPHKPAPKRTLMEAAPLRDRSKKQKVREPVVEETGPLPEPEDMPPVEDDGSNTKPPQSYAQLIGMAILRAPNRRLTLAQIYKWISDTFAYYRNTPEMGWQNSIRHNLSLSKAFSKQERPKDDPGKGHYWRINPGFEQQFHKVKPARRATNPESFMQSFSGDLPRPSTSRSSFPPPSTVAKTIDSSKFPEDTELSSDATIPCSDPAPHEGQEAEHHMPPPRHIPSSPPPADIQSSPPAPARSIREGTPPQAARVPSQSRSGGRKRKFNVFGDSGYYSSIESSAVKGTVLGPLLTSEADLERPTMKRGRAEEEIARIRGSSYDSPSKTRPYMKQPNSNHLISSPFRGTDVPGEGPITPAIVFKRPALPPASASPNTNLRNHRNRMRELVGGSPDKSMGVMVDTSFLQGLSPAVQIPDEENVNLTTAGFESTYDVFNDFHYLDSPTKPSAKRPRLERAATTAGILADITGLRNNNSRTSTPSANWRSPFLDMPCFDSPVRNESPVKAPTSKPLPPLPEFTLTKPDSTHATGLLPPQTFEIPAEENLFVDLHSDDSEEPGFDLTQAFPRIGASVAPNGSPSKPSRPTLGRSSTVRF